MVRDGCKSDIVMLMMETDYQLIEYLKEWD
jgi:hypothetical protein